VYLRFGAAVAALGAAAAAVVVAVLLVRSVPGPPATTAASTGSGASAPAVGGTGSGTASGPLAGGRIATPDFGRFPSPPPGAVVLAQEAGTRALALAVKSGLVRVSILRLSGEGQSGLPVSVQFGGGARVTTADACGPGCYQVRPSGLPVSPVTVRIGGTPYRFDLPTIPAPDGTRIVARAADTWNSLKTLVWHERLASSPTDVLVTEYRAVAPHSLSYTIEGASAAVIIGGTRWDRPSPTGRWASSPQNPPLRQPQPFWHDVTDAHVVGTAKIGSHTVWRVSFFDPSTPSWFEASIDQQTYRTLRLDMTAAAHFMHHVYGPFDAPIEIRPPATT
jgi:hypothetical protein